MRGAHGNSDQEHRTSSGEEMCAATSSLPGVGADAGIDDDDIA